MDEFNSVNQVELKPSAGQCWVKFFLGREHASWLYEKENRCLIATIRIRHTSVRHKEDAELHGQKRTWIEFTPVYAEQALCLFWFLLFILKTNVLQSTILTKTGMNSSAAFRTTGYHLRLGYR
jgi:hypothetical protein